MVRIRFLSMGGDERSIFLEILRHLSIVRDCAQQFAALVAATSRNNKADAGTAFDAVLLKEKEADVVQRELGLRIAEGSFFGGVREDILNLIEKIDNVADSAKDASRLLEIDQELPGPAISILSSDEMQEFLSDLLSSISALRELVEAFNIDRKTILSRVHRVEEFEEAADGHKDELLKNIFSESKLMDPISVIQLRDLMYIADDIADNAEDASDVILVLVAKGYG